MFGPRTSPCLVMSARNTRSICHFVSPCTPRGSLHGVFRTLRARHSSESDRSQIVLNQLTDHGRSVCSSLGTDPGPWPRASLEHAFWVMKVRESFEGRGYHVTREHSIRGDGTIDLLADRPGERVAIELETGKSDIRARLEKRGGYQLRPTRACRHVAVGGEWLSVCPGLMCHHRLTRRRAAHVAKRVVTDIVASPK